MRIARAAILKMMIKLKLLCTVYLHCFYEVLLFVIKLGRSYYLFESRCYFFELIVKYQVEVGGYKLIMRTSGRKIVAVGNLIKIV